MADQIQVGTDYEVQDKDTLSGIAKRAYNDDSRDTYMVIYNANTGVIGKNPDLIYPGQVLHIPPRNARPNVQTPKPGPNVQKTPKVGADYEVQDKDTLSGIAKRAYNDDSRDAYMVIYNANTKVIGKNPDLIHPGQILHIPPRK